MQKAGALAAKRRRVNSTKKWCIMNKWNPTIHSIEGVKFLSYKHENVGRYHEKN